MSKKKTRAEAGASPTVTPEGYIIDQRPAMLAMVPDIDALRRPTLAERVDELRNLQPVRVELLGMVVDGTKPINEVVREPGWLIESERGIRDVATGDLYPWANIRRVRFAKS